MYGFCDCYRFRSHVLFFPPFLSLSLSLVLSRALALSHSFTWSLALSNALALALTGLSTGESAGVADEFTLLENKSKLCFEKMIEAGVMCKVFLWILKSTGFVKRIEDKMADKMAAAAWQERN